MSKLSDHYVVSIMIQEDFSSGKSIVDLFENILKTVSDDSLKRKLKENYYSIVGKTNKEYLDDFKYDYNYAKKNLLYYKVSELSKIENNDPAAITDISFTLDLSKNKNVDQLSENKFTSCLHFPSV